MGMQTARHDLAKGLASLAPLHQGQDGWRLHVLQGHWGVSGEFQYITP
jgi:hypothetical protein